MKLSTLKKSAQQSTRYHGHSMAWQLPNGRCQEARCRYCGAWVALNEAPPPNGIDIGGPAVARGCKR